MHCLLQYCSQHTSSAVSDNRPLSSCPISNRVARLCRACQHKKQSCCKTASSASNVCTALPHWQRGEEEGSKCCRQTEKEVYRAGTVDASSSACKLQPPTPQQKPLAASSNNNCCTKARQHLMVQQTTLPCATQQTQLTQQRLEPLTSNSCTDHDVCAANAFLCLEHAAIYLLTARTTHSTHLLQCSLVDVLECDGKACTSKTSPGKTVAAE